MDVGTYTNITKYVIIYTC